MEDEVDFFCEDFDGVDFAALEKRFGLPEEVANNFQSELGWNSLERTNTTKRKLMYIVVTAIVVLVMGVGIHAYYVQRKIMDVQYIESITYEEDAIPYVTGSTFAADSFSD